MRQFLLPPDLAALALRRAGSGRLQRRSRLRLKETLTRGAEIAVDQLGKPNGFMGDARVRIPLPDSIRKAEKMMRTLGAGKYADELIETMNHAAELAVVEAKPILVNAVKNMSFDDARGILTGGDDAATQYFRRATSADLTAKFLPSSSRPPPRLNLPTSTTTTPARRRRWGCSTRRMPILTSTSRRRRSTASS